MIPICCQKLKNKVRWQVEKQESQNVLSNISAQKKDGTEKR
jgi:hypothetical protein